MGRPRALVLVRLSWVLRGGSDNVDAAADADATFQGPARPVWKQESERCRRACGCPGSWQVASSREAEAGPLARAYRRHWAVRPSLSPQKRDLRPPGVGAVLGAAYRGAGEARRDPGEAGTRGDGRSGGVRAAPAGLAQLTRQRRRRGKRAGPVAGGWGGAGWGARGAGRLTCARYSPGAGRGRGCERLCRHRRRRCPGDRGRAGVLGGGAAGPAARPRPASPGPARTTRPPPHLPPSPGARLGASGAPLACAWYFPGCGGTADGAWSPAPPRPAGS